MKNYNVKYIIGNKFKPDKFALYELILKESKYQVIDLEYGTENTSINYRGQHKGIEISISTYGKN